MPSVKNYNALPTGARELSDYVCSRSAVTTSEQITVPAGATHVLISSNLPFAIAMGTNPTAVYPASDVDDGTAHELINPETPAQDRMFQLRGAAKIAVAAGSAAVITAAFFTH